MNLLQAIGNTPLVELVNLSPNPTFACSASWKGATPADPSRTDRLST